MSLPRCQLLLLLLIAVCLPSCDEDSQLDDSDSEEGPPLCEGATIPSNTCVSDDDCASGSRCSPESIMPAACPADLPPEHQCDADSDCGDSRLCGLYQWPHGCPLAERRCMDDCRVVPTTCTDGERCGSDGFCVTLHCETDGYECGANLECGGTYPDDHGCSRKRCDTHEDCDCGRCIDESGLRRCFDGPGSCTTL